MSFYYEAFGLVIETDIQFSELRSIERPITADVTIMHANLEVPFLQGQGDGFVVAVNSERAYYRVEGVVLRVR